MDEINLTDLRGYRVEKIKIKSLCEFGPYIAASKIYTDTGKIIPFGAIDFDKNLLKEKSISEMIERIVWYEAFKRCPNIFRETVGWASHLKNYKEYAINSSIGELLERDIFSFLLRERFWVSMNNVNIEIGESSFKFLKYIPDSSFCFIVRTVINSVTEVFISFVLSHVEIEGNNGYLLGMGRGDSLNNSLEHAILEQFLIATTFKANKLKKIQDNNINLSVNEYNQFLEIFFRTNSKFKRIPNSKRYKPPKIIYYVNATALAKSVLGHCFGRLVFCSKFSFHELNSVFLNML